MREGIGRFELEGPVIAVRGLIQQAQTMLDKAPVAERVSVVGLALDGLVVAGESLIEAVQVLESIRAFVVCLGEGSASMAWS
jgi:hypothetical protein